MVEIKLGSRDVWGNEITLVKDCGKLRIKGFWRDMRHRTPQELWNLREHLQVQAGGGHPYFSQAAADLLPEVDTELEERGFLVKGRAREVSPKRLPSPKEMK